MFIVLHVSPSMTRPLLMHGESISIQLAAICPLCYQSVKMDQYARRHAHIFPMTICNSVMGQHCNLNRHPPTSVRTCRMLFPLDVMHWIWGQQIAGVLAII